MLELSCSPRDPFRNMYQYQVPRHRRVELAILSADACQITPGSGLYENN